MKNALRIILFALIVLLLAFLGISAFLWLTTPGVAWLRMKNPRETAMMISRENREQGQPGQRYWDWVRLKKISPYLIQAVIINEDVEFYKHKGFNFRAIRDAVKADLRAGKIIRGGSTITQQLAKNLFLKPSRSLMRKIREALISFQMEKELTKERILEIYLNVIEWGPGVYGAEAASQFYFKKPASELRLSEAIRLASVVSSPLKYSPLDDENKFLKLKQIRTTFNMFMRGWIDKDSYIQALRGLNTPLPAGFENALNRVLIFHQVVFLI